jgi:hypothetical protein
MQKNANRTTTINLIANCLGKALGFPPRPAGLILTLDTYVEMETIVREVAYEDLDEFAGDGVPDEYQKRLEVIAANLEATQTDYG